MGQKEFLTANEASAYLGMNRDYLYKLTSKKAIPYYSPTGRHILFKKSELDAWIMDHRVPTYAELTSVAQESLI